MLHERATTDHSALASLGPSAAVFLPGDDGCAVAIHEASAPPHAVEAAGASSARRRHRRAAGARPWARTGSAPTPGRCSRACRRRSARSDGSRGGSSPCWPGGRAREGRGSAPPSAPSPRWRGPMRRGPPPSRRRSSTPLRSCSCWAGTGASTPSTAPGVPLLAQAGGPDGVERAPAGAGPGGRPRPGRRAGGRMHPAGVAAGGGGRGPPVLRCEIGRIERPLAARGGGVRFLLTAAPAEAEASIEALLTGRYRPHPVRGAARGRARRGPGPARGGRAPGRLAPHGAQVPPDRVLEDGRASAGRPRAPRPPADARSRRGVRGAQAPAGSGLRRQIEALRAKAMLTQVR